MFSAYLRWWDAHPWVALIVIGVCIAGIWWLFLRAAQRH
jgi:hypothetical protein